MSCGALFFALAFFDGVILPGSLAGSATLGAGASISLSVNPVKNPHRNNLLFPDALLINA